MHYYNREIITFSIVYHRHLANLKLLQLIRGRVYNAMSSRGADYEYSLAAKAANNHFKIIHFVIFNYLLSLNMKVSIAIPESKIPKICINNSP